MMGSSAPPEHLERVRALVTERTGLQVPVARRQSLDRAIVRAARDIDAQSVTAFVHALLADEDRAFTALLTALDIGETHFFRDRDQIDHLRRVLLPALIQRRATQRRLRIWSAGCSSGEEPYTLAIVVRQTLDLASWDVEILATDVNPTALARAEEGRYRPWSFRGGISPHDLAPSIVPDGEHYVVAAGIRRMVTFRRINLAAAAYPAPVPRDLDLIVCRNVLLYVEHARARAIISRLWASLADGGSLVVSRVDATLPIFDRLRSYSSGSGVFTKSPLPEASGSAAAGHAATAATAATRRRVRAHGASPGGAPAAVGEPMPIEVALAAWRHGDRATAERVVDEALARDAMDASLRYVRGLLRLAADDLDPAYAAFRGAAYADPSSAIAYLGQGMVLARRGQAARAAAAFETSARLVADLDPAACLLQGDDLRVADLLEIVAAARATLASEGRTR